MLGSVRKVFVRISRREPRSSDRSATIVTDRTLPDRTATVVTDVITHSYCSLGCGHEFLLDSLLSSVGRDVSNLDFHISAAPKALLKFEDSVRGNMARTIPAFT